MDGKAHCYSDTVQAAGRDVSNANKKQLEQLLAHALTE